MRRVAAWNGWRRADHGAARRWLSSGKTSPLRGTSNLVGQACAEYAHVEEMGRRVAKLHGMDEVRVPVVQHAEIYKRSLGEMSDVVSKEMFAFQLKDSARTEVVLRPEATAAVACAAFPEAAAANAGLKLWYCGPMFRYERPQHGRRREFNQFGIELVNSAAVEADVCAIEAAKDYLDALELDARLKINTLGDAESLARYSERLKAHFAGFEDRLSDLSRDRLREGRALRILDSKSRADAEAIASAPDVQGDLSPEARDRFQAVLRALEALGIPYEVDARLVRGLDYYAHTVFEFVAGDGAGRDLTVLAGGRYDRLAETLGVPKCPPVPSVGWAAGVERLVLERKRLGRTLPAPRKPSFLVLKAAAESEEDAAALGDHTLRVARALRRKGFTAERDLRAGKAGNLSKSFKYALKQQHAAVVVVRSQDVGAGGGAFAFELTAVGGQRQRLQVASEADFDAWVHAQSVVAGP